MSERNKQIVDQVNAAFRENNVEKFLECCTDDVEWTMVGDNSVSGKEAIRAWMKKMGPQDPPKFGVTQIISEGDFATAYGEMTMDESGQKNVPYSYCDIYRFRNGKIAELRSYVIKTEAKPKTQTASA